MTQKDRIEVLFRDRPRQWIPLPEILDIKPRIAQYGPRIIELRREGMNIVNKYEWKTTPYGREKHSWYMYVPKNECIGALC